ncbi:MAG: FixH family protein [Candidatus Zixiibacteriota bacterium]
MTEIKKKSRWGVGIAVVYGAFVLAVLGTVAASRFQQVDLVSRDYYDKEIKYQEQIEKLKRSRPAESQLAIENNDIEKALVVRLPAGIEAAAVTGKLRLFRPSNASLDRSFDLKFDDTAADRLEYGDLARGMWKIKVDWQLDTLQYYQEEELYIE